MNRASIALTPHRQELKTRGGWPRFAAEERTWLGLRFESAAIEFALTGIISPMTLVEITFELQSPLTAKQLSDLAEFANTYGLRRFRHDEAHHLITFEYDASRLRQSQVVHALAGANIAVKRIVPQSGQEIIPA
jgi:hypothetical protein